MDGVVVIELLIILVLILANGFFSAAEIAIIAAGRGKLQQQAADGNRGAKIALELASDPNRFLPTVQVGISVIGTFTAAFSGVHLGESFARVLNLIPIPWIQTHRTDLALGIVVIALSFVSIILIRGCRYPDRQPLSRWTSARGIGLTPDAMGVAADPSSSPS